VRRRSIARHNDLVPLPFTRPDQDPIPKFRLPQYITREKTSKYRQALGISTQTRDILEDSDHIQPEVPTNTLGTGRSLMPARIRYVVHEDGGEVIEEEDSSQHGEVEEQVINLPPVYSSLSRSRPFSRASIQTHTHPDS